MKEASGELNLTVVTIIAIAAIAGFFTMFIWPKIQETIEQQWENVSNTQAADEAWNRP